jgi:hypothetical protein
MTAIKKKADSLRFHFSGAAATGEHQEQYSVTAVDQTDDHFNTAEDISALVVAGDTITIDGSTGNDADFTVESVSWTGTATEVHVTGEIPDATVDGNLQLSNREAWALGGASTREEIEFIGISLTNPIANLTVDHAEHIGVVGDGTLEAVGVDTVQYTPPGGAAGPVVEVLDGETKVVEGAVRNDYLRVTRTSATDLTGTITVTLVENLNALFSDIDSATATAGETQYRAIFVRNEQADSAVAKLLKLHLAEIPGTTAQTTDVGSLGASGGGTIETSGTFEDAVPESGYAQVRKADGSIREQVYYSSRTSSTITVPSAGRGMSGTTAAAGAVDDELHFVAGIRVAAEVPDGSGLVQAIASENTAPSGVSWTSGIDAADGIDHGDLAAGAELGLWVEYEIPVGAEALARQTTIFRLTAETA